MPKPHSELICDEADQDRVSQPAARACDYYFAQLRQQLQLLVVLVITPPRPRLTSSKCVLPWLIDCRNSIARNRPQTNLLRPHYYQSPLVSGQALAMADNDRQGRPTSRCMILQQLYSNVVGSSRTPLRGYTIFRWLENRSRPLQ